MNIADVNLTNDQYRTSFNTNQQNLLEKLKYSRNYICLAFNTA